ncbi:LpxL/LpxP family acyltransferase [Pseudoalteromonas sp. G4]|uniref:LpxL/LpxP family acyltransferase n=1 Tax=Pseudoalteromonas sp. G4 TaxID=2992761 RepID=UPI00237DE827|nr:acyltransferase [Pseudoalteromonas sp. G4]MDE3272003.1 acyltransferase [Pseudoalteromonas sp. G4]
MQERGTLLGMRILLGFYRLVGRKVLWLMLFPVVFYFYCTGKTQRKASIAFLNQVESYKGQPIRAGFWQGLTHFCKFADSAFDKIDAWLGRISIDAIRYQNHQEFTKLQQSKQGAIFIGSHLGNLEVCRALSQGRYAVTINVLVFTHHAVEFNKVLKQINNDAQVNLIQVTDMSPTLAILLKQKIEQGEVIVIVGDRTSSSVAGRVNYCNFLGKPAPFSQGPFILASLLECPVYYLFCLKTDNQYQVIFEKVADKLKFNRKTRQQDLQTTIQHFSDRLGHFASEYPYQWFNFYDFWTDDKQVSRD